MILIVASAVLWVGLLGYQAEGQSDWCYGATGCGPDTWGNYIEACNGERQSPIDISFTSTDFLKVDNNIAIDLSKNYAAPGNFDLRNTGRNLLLQPKAGSTFSLSGSHLNSNFTFNLASFHWGLSEEGGTEHVFNGDRYALELQLMHTQQTTNDGGVVTVAFSVLFQLGSTDNPELKPIIEAFKGVIDPLTQTEVSGRVLGKFFEFDLKPEVNLVLYNGSWTTPDCSQGVLWHVFEPLKPISSSQLDEFRLLRSKDYDSKLSGNLRPDQEINGREILYKRATFKTDGALLPNIFTFDGLTRLLEIK